MAHRSAGQSVLSRLLIVLESFDQDHPSLTIAELTRRSGLPAPTVYRLVGDLVETGLLERAENREVRLGVRLWELAALAPRALGLRVVAMPFMVDLQATVRQHVVLTVLEGHESVVIEKLSARDAVTTYHRLGGRLPLHATTGGLILLAHSDQKLQDAFLSAPLRAYTPHTPTEPEVVRRLLAGVRERGHVVCKEYVTLGAMGVGVPVWSSHGEVIAALTVAIAVKDAQPMMHVPALTVASRGIARALTSLPPPRQLPRFFPVAVDESTMDR
jgi:DNA-binding IclR family transcriptional regulator